MAFSINEIRSNLQYGGARATLFQVQFSNPVSSVGEPQIPFRVMAASLPDSTLGTIQIPYFGRILKQAGDRVFSPWQVTLLNDEDFKIRNDLEAWSNAINSLEGNIRTVGRSSTAYKSQAQVWQLSRDGTMLREYTFYGIWPSSVDPIQLDWGGMDQVQTYGVTFEYDWYAPTGGITGSYPVA